MNRKPLIWDFPLRIYHWALTLSFSIALSAADDSPVFRWNMLFGVVAVAVLAVRLVLGVVGSKPDRFTSFPLGVRTVSAYFKDIVTLRPQRREFGGNNPGSALAAVTMFLLVPSVVLTGLGRTWRLRRKRMASSPTSCWA